MVFGKVNLSCSKQFYELFKKKLFSLKYIVAAILDKYSNNFQRHSIFMSLQINDLENGRRCI